ncbi:Hsp20/alpha crystallin family protein [Verticiella sediminum]|uniref:Hsp20/alpha crystallin family protein n=1 Tax=Verticiella sediminum TaxID=1247510 RepID=A0A556ADW8_9BURK|nr:Hsp20/alpha crystallin family protein [Verticiella sediminum]TSH91067.1 Hsp20/alpha crystallin family protein [Verticiella sediminum]
MSQTDTTQQQASERDAVIAPAVDIWETDAGIDLAADLPGVPRESLNIGVDGDTLTIEGTVTLEAAAGVEPLHAEVRTPRYQRSFTLSRELNAEAITANFVNGTLRLHIPRQEAAKPRRIEITA